MIDGTEFIKAEMLGQDSHSTFRCNDSLNAGSRAVTDLVVVMPSRTMPITPYLS